MTEKTLLFLTLLTSLTSACLSDKSGTKETKIIYDSNNDTLELRHLFQNGNVREVIFYRDNHPYRNIGFQNNGDTVDWPNAIMDSDSSQMFIYIPIDKYLHSISYIHFRNHLGDTEEDSTFYGDLTNGYIIPLDKLRRPNRIKGVLNCKDTLSGKIDSYIFDHRL